MNSAVWSDVLGEELAVELEVPAAPCERPPTPVAAAIRLLEAIALLEERTVDQSKEDSVPEIRRLELKVDVLTDLVSSLLADRIPKPMKLWVSRQGFVGPVGLLAPGQSRLELYPTERIALPLVLEIGAVEIRDDSCGARWRSLDEELREALGRWVFRLHRRQVALRRGREASQT